MAAVLVLLSALAPVPTLRAQTGMLSLGVGGGVSLPQGEFSDAFETGWHGMATLALGVPLMPIGLRLDGAYHRFGTKALTGALQGTSERVISGTLNATLRLPIVGSPVTPYIIAGGGTYNIGCTGNSLCETANEFGWNAGAGLRLSALGLNAFAEARYHRVAVTGGAVQYVPITVGLFF
jgi:opacity protein-like surface antigen